MTNPLAKYFSEFIVRRAGLSGDGALLLARVLELLVAALEKSDSALDLGECGQPFSAAEFLGLAPEYDSWEEFAAEARSALAAGSWDAVVAKDADDGVHPLIWNRTNNYLYLQKYRNAERRIGKFVRDRLAKTDCQQDPGLTDERICAINPSKLGTTQAADQREAIRAAVGRPLAMVTGGPGTGKTTTLGAILALELEKNPSLRIAEAAPTGKASAQMRTALNDFLKDALIDETRKKILANLRPVTLHGLLGVRPDRLEIAARNHTNPLPYDLVVVDEGSMADLLLFDKLTDALAPETRLLLLGDKDQLASVEAGAVFSELAGVLSKPGHGCYKWLRHNFRSAEMPTLVALAQDLANAEVASAVAKCAELRLTPETPVATDPRFQIRELPKADASEKELSILLEAWGLRRKAAELKKCSSAGADETALAALAERWLQFHEEFKILCALVNGPHGVKTFNALLSDLYGIADGADGFPVIVTQNDRETGLRNGDTGVWTGKRVWFRVANPKTGDSEVKSFSSAQLPNREPAFAITIHKSQGSTYDKALVVLPENENAAILTRNLLYTGITRAKRNCMLWSPDAVLKKAIETPTDRVSGLRAELSW